MSIRALLTALLTLLLPSVAVAQSVDEAGWGLRIRATLSGTSHGSEPSGYRMYSGVALEAGVVRHLGGAFAAELTLRTESREVEGPFTGAAVEHLGSLEVLPVGLHLQWRPRDDGTDTWRPYLGAGVTFVHVWEKSGALDSTDAPVALRPTGQVGMDWRLTDDTRLNLDARWMPWDVKIEGGPGAVPPVVQVDPVALGLGFGVRF